jgi:hypothetical protein
MGKIDDPMNAATRFTAEVVRGILLSIRYAINGVKVKRPYVKSLINSLFGKYLRNRRRGEKRAVATTEKRGIAILIISARSDILRYGTLYPKELAAERSRRYAGIPSQNGETPSKLTFKALFSASPKLSSSFSRSASFLS